MEVNVFVPSDTKAKAVSVRADDIKVTLSVGGVTYLSGEWPYKVEPDEDPDLGTMLDWEVRDFDGRRAVRLTVRKQVMPGGLSIITWWRSVLKGDPAIEVTEIKDRKKEANESFAKAWKEANISFKAKTANHKPTLIDRNGNIVEEDEDDEAVDAAMEQKGIDTHARP